MEDEPSLVRTLSDRLAAEGYEVESAGDADSALESAASGVFDVIILDIMLPGRDGFEVCRELRQRGFEMPILIFFLARIGVVTPSFLMRNFRYAVLIIALTAAILTPTGDMLTMTVFAVPMILLYLLGVGVAWLFGRGEGS